jgi:hypothetical protein
MARFYFGQLIRLGANCVALRRPRLRNGKLLPRLRRISIILKCRLLRILDRTEGATYGAEFWRSPAVQQSGRCAGVAAMDGHLCGCCSDQCRNVLAAALARRASENDLARINLR